MQYVTVYEITGEGFPWWIPVWLAVIVLISAIILLLTRNLGPITTLVRIGMALFVGVCVTLAGLNLRGRAQIVDAYRQGRYATVQGQVAHHSFTGKSECFDVAAIRFCRGTVQSDWKWALVHDGEPVRIAYSGEPGRNSYPLILRIETGRNTRDALTPSAARGH